ncbi:MAG: polymer-forming cytoskeletal protein [Deltaproteobacteria bacterium]|nr:polymer-forming cytoskeletal protein [Deltaproteobacteria bacterium]
MWRWRKDKLHPDHEATSVIDAGCEFDGRLNFVGTLIVNGKFKGELVSSSTLVVGEAGELEAEVRAGTVILAGQISGHITAKERVELRKTARMYGDIVSPVLVLEEGVIFDGHCNMKGKDVQVIQLKGNDNQQGEQRGDKRATV